MDVKISGTILNSKNNEPIALAKIRLKVGDKEIGALFFTDEHGNYEFQSDEDYIGQTLKYIIEKDGFEEKTFSTFIDKDQIEKKFLLRENEALKEKFATLKGFVYGIIIISAIITILAAILIGSAPVAKYDTNITTVGLNDKVTIDVTIDKKWDWMPFVNPNWELQSEDQWILFDKSDGNEPSTKLDGNKSETVQITLLTPDFQFSPGKREVNFYLVNTKLDFFDFIDLKFFADAMPINLDVTDEKKKPDLDITVEPTSEDPQKFIISIKNVGDGAPWWTLRSDKTWIEMWSDSDGTEKYDSNERRSDDGEVYFVINMSNIKEKDELVEGRITLGYNNEGKDMIHVFVCKKESSFKINTTIESWYLPDYYNKTVTEPQQPDICAV
ncbi:hypothetical protein RE474_13505 [Methanolobus sediminis]|uniref:Uncharacterized protein n=1 Tax=Methanolobus sediminis TaxID=3072978 RepID=A0AA51YLK6_9EURY|nr:hypothetical protein [Methanolobus sediminis]WMW25079.1 hypothetical protein RE474_13505 [Methanolobus sediminis]